MEASRYFCGGAGETISIERLIAANDSRRRCSVAKEEQSEGNKSKNERTKRSVEFEWRSQEREIKVAP